VITFVCDTPSAVAVKVTFFETETVVAVTLNVAEVPPVATVTDDGAFRALLLLESATTI
jgi:hypothetical protein